MSFALLRSLPLATAGLLASAIGSAATEYATVGNWLVQQGEHSCNVGFPIAQGGIFTIDYDLGLSSVRIIIGDPALKSVQSGDKFSMKLYFMKRGRLDDGWGNVTVTGYRTSDGNTGLFFKMAAPDALTDLQTSTNIAIFMDNRLIENIKLTGSAPAITKLAECSLKANRENPSDPLADAERVKN